MQNTDGFVVGTLIHTKSGTRPIEEIKVGDYVLSHYADPRLNATCDYKRVKRVARFRERPILQFVWHYPTEPINGAFDQLYATPNPLVWSHPQGWVAVARVPYTSAGGDDWYGRNLVLANGRVGERYEINSVYRTTNKNVAYVHCDGWASGKYINFSASPYAFLTEEEEREYESGREDQDSDDWLTYSSDVCHLEIEDWHTFFVGRSGLLVHDACFNSANIPIHLADGN